MILNFFLEIFPIYCATIIYITFICFYVLKEKFCNYFWPISIIFFVILRSRDLYMGYLNPDELQWLVSANSLKHDTHLFLNYFIIADYSRFFTILPLTVIGFFSDYIELHHARALNIILILLFCFLQFKIIRILFQKSKLAYLTCSCMIILMAFASHPDFISYNSEIAAIVLLSLAFYLFLVASSKNNFIGFLVSAMVFTLVPFAKEQALFISIFILLALVYHLIRGGNMKAILALIIGCSFVSIGFILFIELLDAWALIKIHISNSQVYLAEGLGGSKISFKDRILIFFQSTYSNTSNLIFGILFLFSFFSFLFNFNEEDSKVKKIFFFYSSVCIVSLYSVIKPGNNFVHYSILNYFFLSFFISYLLKNLSQIKQLKLQNNIFILLISVICLFFSNRKVYPISAFFQHTNNEQDEVSLLISKYTKPNDHILVWGWENKYYLESRTLRSSYFLYPQFIQKNYPKHQESLKIYENDILENKPKLIIEAMGPGRFYFENKTDLQIENISKSLNFILSKDYKLIKEGENFRIFSRN
jgi:hypothetical protein